VTDGLADATAQALSKQLAAGDVSSVEILDAVTDRILDCEPHLHAFTHLSLKRARENAAHSDARRREGRVLGPLDGIPYAVKDLFDVAGEPTRAGSQHQPAPAQSDSAAVAALRSAGMILVGRTNMDELAYGMTSAPTRNARHLDHSPGGSSGGSAAAVGSGEVPLALGSDTGGSVQVPAGLNGIVGFKPSHDLISTVGTTVLSPSLDHVGLLARSVGDIELLLDPLVGNTARDSRFRDGDLSQLVVAVPDAFYADQLAPDVLAAYERALESLASAGARLYSFRAPMWEHYAAVEDLICITEFAAEQGERVRQFPNDFGPVARHYVEAGYKIPAAAYTRAKYAQSLMRTRWIESLGQSDFVLTPIAPITAPRVGSQFHTWPDSTVDDVNELLGRLAVPSNILGLPAITLPGGVDSAELPIGLQLIGRHHGDRRLLATAAAIEPLLVCPIDAATDHSRC
jgi:aspartyl-tRNA(Asn)/glutamyl-tRNA(Gln) amidotransferase subunit A